MCYKQHSPGHEHGQQYRQPETKSQRIQSQPGTHSQLKWTTCPSQNISSIPKAFYHRLFTFFSPICVFTLIHLILKGTQSKRTSPRCQAFQNQCFTENMICSWHVGKFSFGKHKNGNFLRSHWLRARVRSSLLMMVAHYRFSWGCRWPQGFDDLGGIYMLHLGSFQDFPFISPWNS